LWQGPCLIQRDGESSQAGLLQGGSSLHQKVQTHWSIAKQGFHIFHHLSGGQCHGLLRAFGGASGIWRSDRRGVRIGWHCASGTRWEHKRWKVVEARVESLVASHDIVSTVTICDPANGSKYRHNSGQRKNTRERSTSLKHGQLCVYMCVYIRIVV
jgi:hypothetical protein